MSLRVVPIALLVVVGALLAQTPEKPKPIVTVTKTDNSTVRGRLLEYGTDELKLETGTKPGEGEVVVVAWKDVVRVSSGLTRQKALDEWKAANKDRLCDTCHGNRTMRCGVCHGTGHDAAASKDCAKCKGAGETKCVAPRCTEGKIPCPGKCLKLSEGQWVKKDDGKRWRNVKLGAGTLSLSEAHLGEVWEVENGQPVNRGKCPTCQGTTQVDCAKCEATGKTVCPTCLADKAAPDCGACEGGSAACETCKGSGLKSATP